MCNEAGLLRGTSAHGLRKAACRRLAEAGCGANLIAAVSGHKSLREVQRYTEAADQARMARAYHATVKVDVRQGVHTAPAKSETVAAWGVPGLQVVSNKGESPRGT